MEHRLSNNMDVIRALKDKFTQKITNFFSTLLKSREVSYKVHQTFLGFQTDWQSDNLTFHRPEAELTTTNLLF